MAESPLLQSNLLSIVPGSITIENFIPGRVYKERLTIENKTNIPIIINLRSSDNSKLILNKSLLRIEVKEKKMVDLVIQDRINYSSKNLPTKPKKIYIYINGEIIEDKFEITLMYFCNNNTLSNYGKDNSRLQIQNNSFKHVPSYYLTQYQRLEMSTNRRRLLIDKTCNIFIQRYETDEVNALKRTINSLLQQISNLKKNMGKNNINNISNISNMNNISKSKNEFRKLGKSHNSFFIMGNKLDDPQGKFKIDNDIKINAVLAKNKILLIENSIMKSRIEKLEAELEKFNNLDGKNNFEEYKNYNYNEIENNNNNYNNNNNDDNNYWKNDMNNIGNEMDMDNEVEYNEQENNEDYQDFQNQEEGNIDINDYENVDNNEY